MLSVLPVLTVLEQLVRPERYLALRVVGEGIQVKPRKEYGGIAGDVVLPPHEYVGEHPRRPRRVRFPEHIDAGFLPYVRPAPEHLLQRVPVEVGKPREDILALAVIPFVPVLARMYVAVSRVLLQVSVEKFSSVHVLLVPLSRVRLCSARTEDNRLYFTQFKFSG